MKKYVKTLLLVLLLFVFSGSTVACSSENTKDDNNQIHKVTQNTVEDSDPGREETQIPVEDNDPVYEETQIPVEKLIIGEWRLESQAFSDGRSSSWKLQKVKLYEDGTCSVNGEMGTWKIVADELMVLGSYGGRFMNSDAIVGRFSCNEDTLEFYEAQVDGKDNSVNLIYKRAK